VFVTVATAGQRDIGHVTRQIDALFLIALPIDLSRLCGSGAHDPRARR
jgi:hypothetical protein